MKELKYDRRLTYVGKSKLYKCKASLLFLTYCCIDFNVSPNHLKKLYNPWQTVTNQKKKRKKDKRKHFLDGWLGVEFNNL